MNTWFTSDTHFGHDRIRFHSKRPFASVEEMDAVLIENWNRVVGEKDDVWHLGDFNMKSEHDTAWYVKQLHGRIHIVWGNHDDRDAMRAAMVSRRVGHPLFASEQEVKYLRLNGEKITLYHYAQRVWRNSHHGAWHLYGHSHGSLPHFHRSMDVGVDVHKFTPISFDEIKAYMEKQDYTHHHPEMLTDPWPRDKDWTQDDIKSEMSD